MGFQKDESEQLLADTGRHCCICGLLHKVQLHHIIPKEEGGTDGIDNAIPLCPNCHDEVHGRHASGKTTRVYSAAELRLHRQRTIERIGSEGNAARVSGAGPSPGGRAATFERVETLMPKLIAEMRKDLADHLLGREFVLLKRCWSYLQAGHQLEYYYDDHDELDNMVRILQNYGLINDIANNDVRRYVISEDFAEYLMT